MIQIVYGPKGFGKTKIMLDQVNLASQNAKGNVVFITDKRMSTVGINFNVRCLHTEDHKINCSKAFLGFINGLMAGNSDIEYIFIDGLKRIVGNNLRGGKELFDSLKVLVKEYSDLKFIISVSGAKEELPKYILKYIY